MRSTQSSVEMLHAVNPCGGPNRASRSNVRASVRMRPARTRACYGPGRVRRTGEKGSPGCEPTGVILTFCAVDVAAAMARAKANVDAANACFIVLPGCSRLIIDVRRRASLSVRTGDIPHTHAAKAAFRATLLGLSSYSCRSRESLHSIHSWIRFAALLPAFTSTSRRASCFL